MIESGKTIRTSSAVSFLAGCLAIAGAALALLDLATLHLLSPEFDPAWRMVSEYANGRYGWLLSVMFAAWAVSSWALVVAIRSQVSGLAGKVGLLFLAVAGLGEAMAAVFDINHDLGHSLAGALGILGLPVAAMLISASLSRSEPWSDAKRVLLWSANLTWVSVVLLVASFVVMTATYLHVAGNLPSTAPRALPLGVVALVGWTDRLVIVVYCAWAATVAWHAIRLRTFPSQGRRLSSSPVA